jgi:membrane-associated phospholipid phosphatase
LFDFPGYDFPSGHALMSTVVFGLAAFLALRYAGRKVARVVLGVCAALVLAIGFSRIYFGAHWLNDVVGGYLYGLCILALASLLRQQMDLRKTETYY